MPLPPRGDPTRPLHLAVRSMRLLGGMLLLFSTVMTLSVFRFRRGGVGVFASWFMLVALLFYIAPGICFILFSIFLARRQFWAVVASICLASLACLFALFALVALLMAMAANPFHPAMLIPLGIVVLMVFAFAQLIYHLGRSFEAIKHSPPQERGFEPIMVPPLPPAAMYQQPQQHRHPDEPPAPGY